MKTLLLCSLWLGLAVKAAAAPPATFDEFKQLPPAQRDALVADVMSDSYNPDRLKLINWWLRLRLGEESWRWDRQEQLATQNEYLGLLNFFNEYQTLRQSCSMNEWAALNAKGASSSELNEARIRLGKLEEADSYIYKNIVPLLASLAPGAEVKALNGRAQQLVSELYERYGNGNITRQQMAVLDQRAQEMLEQVKKLPKLTAEQQQAVIDALPPEHRLPFGIHYPSK